MPQHPPRPFDLTTLFEIRDFIEDHFENRGYTILGTGGGFGALDISVITHRETVPVVLEFVLYPSGNLEVYIQQTEPDDDEPPAHP